MTLQNTTFTSSQTLVTRREITALHRLAQYIICFGLGMIGGAIGTAAAIGLAIIAQLVLFPASTSLPGLIPLNATAIFLGLMISWLLGWAGYRIIPTLSSCYSSEQGTQVILVVGGLVSLLETTLYMYNLYL